MRFTLQMGGRQVLVLSRDRFVEFEAVPKAADWLADYIVSPENLFTLRAALASDAHHIGLLRLDLADLVVELARMATEGRLRWLLEPRSQAPWRWALPPTPSFEVGAGEAEAETTDLVSEADEVEEEESEYEEVKPEPVIPPEFPRLAKREADTLDLSARKMGNQLDLMRFIGEKAVPESAIAKSYPALANQQANALGEAVADAAGSLEGMAGTGRPPPKSIIAESMPRMAESAGESVKASAGALGEHTSGLITGNPFDRPDSDVAPAMQTLAAQQGQKVTDQAIDTGKTLDTLDGPPANPPPPGIVGEAFTTAAVTQGKSIASAAEAVGETLGPLNEGQADDPPESETKTVFQKAADKQITAVVGATKAAAELLDGIASTLDERAEDPGQSGNAGIFRKDGEKAGDKVGEAAVATAAVLDSLRPDDPKGEASAAVNASTGPSIRLEGPPGVSLSGLMFTVRFGDAEKVFTSDSSGVVKLIGVPEEGYDIIGISDASGLEVVDVRTSTMAPPEEEGEGETPDG